MMAAMAGAAMAAATTAASALADYFDQAQCIFEQAADGQGGLVARDYALAGETVRVHYAGAALAAGLGAAMSPRTANGSAPSLSIHAWGGEMPGGQLPPPPWEAVDYFERGNVRGYHDARWTLAYDRRLEVFSAVDHGRRAALYWARDSANLNYRERSTPMRRVLQGWAQQRGMFVAHAAAVGRPEGGVLIAGRTGSGKSTTALACLRSRLGYAGDDCVLIAANPAPRLHSLYHTAKLNTEVLAWLPEAAPLVVNREHLADEKAVLHLRPAWAERVSDGFPLRAIVLPRPTREPQSLVQPLTAEAAYRAIVPDMLFTALGDARVVGQVMGELVRALPCYALALGTDLRTVPAAIERILDAHPG